MITYIRFQLNKLSSMLYVFLGTKLGAGVVVVLGLFYILLFGLIFNTAGVGSIFIDTMTYCDVSPCFNVTQQQMLIDSFSNLKTNNIYMVSFFIYSTSYIIVFSTLFVLITPWYYHKKIGEVNEDGGEVK